MTSIRPTAGRKKYQCGSTMVEFALTILPLLAFTMLLFDTAWVLFAKACIQEGVRAGVRYAVTSQTMNGYNGQDAAIRAVVQQSSFGFVNAGNASTAVQIHYYSPTNLTEISGAGSNAGGNIIKVVVSGISINPTIPLWRSDSPLVLSASSSDVMESSPNCVPPKR